MYFFQISSGGDRNYGYLIGCEKTKTAAVVDPSPDPVPFSEKADELGLEIKYVINTHTHFDHTGGNDFFEKCGAGVISYGKMESDELRLGEILIKFIHTPGHTEDSMCVLAEKELVTGDTLFVGKVGGTYSGESAKMEFESLKLLMSLDPDIRVWPGHNYGTGTSSTIGEEKKSNPFCRRLNDFEEFVYLKDNWAEYKRKHGIK